MVQWSFILAFFLVVSCVRQKALQVRNVRTPIVRGTPIVNRSTRLSLPALPRGLPCLSCLLPYKPPSNRPILPDALFATNFFTLFTATKSEEVGATHGMARAVEHLTLGGRTEAPGCPTRPCVRRFHKHTTKRFDRVRYTP